MRGLVLIGQRGTGKTTLGELLARHWGIPFADSDLVFQSQQGCSPGDWIRLLGETSFRTKEEKLVRDLLLHLMVQPGVLALGGGAPCRKRTQEWLGGFRRSGGLVLYLTCPMERAQERLEQRAEADPLLRKSDPKLDWLQLFTERHQLYSRCADIHFKNDFEDPQVALARIIHEIESSECKVLKGLCVNGLTSRFWSEMVISVCNRPPGVLAD